MEQSSGLKTQKLPDSDPRLQPFCWDFGGKTVEFQWILQ